MKGSEDSRSIIGFPFLKGSVKRSFVVFFAVSHQSPLPLLKPLQWRHNDHDDVSNHQPHDCLLRRRSKETSKLRVTGLCEGNSPVTGKFPAQRASNAENVSTEWRHRAVGSGGETWSLLRNSKSYRANIKDSGTDKFQALFRDYSQWCDLCVQRYGHGNHTHHNVWDEITYPFLNFNGATVEV